MNYLSLNIRGVIGVEKSNWVKRIKREKKIDFICLQETHQSDLQSVFWARFWDGSPLDFESVNAVGRGGGLVSIWDPEVFHKDKVVKFQNFMVISGTIKGRSERINIVNMQAPNDPSARAQVWDTLLVLRPQIQGWWIALGDFNDVRSRDERVNSLFDHNAAAVFNEAISRLGWLEYRMTGGNFTFISDNFEVKLSKLDRVLVRDSFLSQWPLANLSVLPKFLSDHCPMVLECDDKDFGPIPFKFFNRWTESSEVESIVSEVFLKYDVNLPGDIALAKMLSLIKDRLKKWRASVRLIKDKEQLEVTKAISEIEVKAASIPLSLEEKKLRVQLKKKSQ